MDCPKCDSSEVTQFCKEEVICTHCKTDNSVIYYTCKKCTLIWKSVGGIFVEGLSFEDEDLSIIFEELSNSIPTINIDKKGPLTGAPSTMADLLHKCLKCDAPAYEFANKEFFCSTCGFEWEVK